MKSVEIAAYPQQERQKEGFVPLFLAFGGYLLPGVLLVLSLLWFKSGAIDAEVHNRYLANLRQLQYLDARIDRNVLQARAGMLTYYDPIANDLAVIKKLQADLKQIPSFIDSDGKREIKRSLQNNARLWQQKEETIFKFQSQNAVLINSLSYFPIAIADLLGKTGSSPLKERLNALLQDILLFNLSTDKSRAVRIERKIAEMSKFAGEDRADIAMALAHAQIILSRRARIKDSIGIALTLPTARSSEDLYLTYNRLYQRSLDTSHNYRQWFYLASIATLIAISAWIVLKIRVYALSTRQAEAKYRHLVDNSTSGIFQEMPDGTFLNANSRLAEIYGYESVLALVEGVKDVEKQVYVLPERRRELVSLLSEKGSVTNFESQIYRPDGTKIWISENTRRARARDGSIYYEGTVTDISDRKRAEAALQASEAKFLAAFRSAPHPLAIATIPDGFLLEVNDSFCRETGYSLEEVIGRNGIDLNFYPDPKAHYRMIQLVLEKGTLRHYEIEIVTRRRKIRNVSISAEIVNLNGQDCFLMISDDITARKRVEKALRSAKNAAESANKTKSQFLANMSHELRTPLNIILGFTQLLSRERPIAPQQQEYLATITRSGEHLLALINDVLEMSKIEAGKANLNQNSFDLHRLLDILNDMWQPKAIAKGLQLSVMRLEVPQYIATDESKLRQVLMNLLSNAIKFTQSGGVTVRVEARGNRLFFEVSDTGVAIAKRERKMLFSPFAQTETGRNSQQGTGLGLAISREFVRLMGGNLRLNDQIDSGNTFWFDIPLEIATPVDNPIPQSPIALAENQPSYRILVVEDHLENRQLLVKLLEPIGFEVREAANGREAIALWQSFVPHLIWMDLQMPVMDGYEVTKYIKSHEGSATVIIALTASAFAEERELSLAAGCDDFIRKPFKEAELFQKMSQYLGVEYIYKSPIESAPMPSDPATALSLLDKMPAQWREQLHQAATQVDAEQIMKLIRQIPPEYAIFGQAIGEMASSYRFDKILELGNE